MKAYYKVLPFFSTKTFFVITVKAVLFYDHMPINIQ